MKKYWCPILAVLLTVVLGFSAYGVPVEAERFHPAVAYDPEYNRYLVVYDRSNDASSSDIYGQLINCDGSPAGPEFLISNSNDGEWNPAIAREDTEGRFLVVWEQGDFPNPSHLYGQLVNPNGSLHNSNFVISNATNNKWNPSIAYSAYYYGRFLVVWDDGRGANSRIYGQLVGEDGTLLVTASDVNFTIGEAGGDQYAPCVAYDGYRDRFFVVWSDYRSGTEYDIYGQVVVPDGSLYYDNLIVSDAEGDQVDPKLEYDGVNTRFLVVWEDGRNGTNWDIYGQLVIRYNDTPNYYGISPDTNLIISNTGDGQFNPSIVRDDYNNRFTVVWEDDRSGTWSIYGQHVNRDGTLNGGNFLIDGDNDENASAAAGYYGGVLVVFDTWRSASYDIGLAPVGNGCIPNISISPTSHDFGDVVVGTQSPPQEFTISNDGQGDLTLQQFSISGGNGRFSPAYGGSNPCPSFPTTLTPGTSCTVTAKFSPTSTGQETATLQIDSNDSDTSSIEVSSTGTGVAYPDIFVSLATHDFGNVSTGSPSEQVEISISNTGQGDLNISSAQLSGSEAGMFSWALGGSNPCSSFPTTLSSDASCTLIVQFTPASLGQKSATLIINSNDPDTPASDVLLSGTGVTPDIFVSPNSQDFGSVDVGNSSAPQQFTLSNNGTGDLVVSSMAISGGDAGMFNIMLTGISPCPSLTPTLGPGASCTLSVDFSPTSSGAKSATLRISSNDPDAEDVDVALSGTGVSSYATITVLSPNGGGRPIPSGSTETIQWGAPPQAVKFNLYYSLNGFSWVLIAKDVTGTSHDWQVPTPTANSPKCFVKVVGYNASGKKVGEDKSDAPFTIEVVVITYPNGGEPLYSFASETITWTTNGTKAPVASIKVYYTDNGISWKLINTQTGNPNFCNWNVPSVTTTKTKCKVKVMLYDGSRRLIGSDISDGFFTIQNPS
jgi:hypothetical protein